MTRFVHIVQHVVHKNDTVLNHVLRVELLRIIIFESLLERVLAAAGEQSVR